MTRYIGIRHRRKRTREGEARPTMVAIKEADTVVVHELEDEDSEKDFLLGILPVAWRKVESGEGLIFYDEAEPDKCPEGHRFRHCKRRKPKEDEDLSVLHSSHVVEEEDALTGKKVKRIVTHVPSAYEGLRPGDRVGMVLGGSGDNFASALSRRGEEIGAEVYRLPPSELANLRGLADKEDDHLTLATLVFTHVTAFYLVRRRDRDSIRVKAVLRLLRDAMKARIVCEQQIMSALVGRVFLSEEGKFQEGTIKARYDAEIANDQIYLSLLAEEKRRRGELKRVVQAHPIWQAVFAGIEGVGERLAAGLIGPIGDIRRFWVNPLRMEECYQKSRDCERLGRYMDDLHWVSREFTDSMTIYDKLGLLAEWKRAQGKLAEAENLEMARGYHKERGRLLNKGGFKLRAFCGVHVLNVDKNGQEVPRNRQFPRRREGSVANWHPEARQALYLLGDQFNRRPHTYWGGMLLRYKLVFRQRHPVVIEEEVNERRGSRTVTVKKKRYTNGHIHKMAVWRTLTKFVSHLSRVWTRIEEEAERELRETLKFDGKKPTGDAGQSKDDEGEAPNAAVA